MLRFLIVQITLAFNGACIGIGVWQGDQSGVILALVGAINILIVARRTNR